MSYLMTRSRGGSGAVATVGAGAARWIGLLAILAVVAAAPVQAQSRGAPDSFADLAERLLPTVVNIATSQKIETPRGEDFEEFFEEFFERRGGEPPSPERRRQNSLGSGFIIDSTGYIVTNRHVVKDADEITVRLADDSSLEATLIGSDDKTDLALLKVESDKPLPSASWGRSQETRIGDWVIAIGNPFGLGGTVTAGIVSARQRDINSGPYDDYIQTDAAINRGNSGGPMFNLDGEVIGVNTAIFSPSGGSVGIGFAIPAALARNVIDQLREHGEVRRGWLGVRIQTVTEELAEGLRLEQSHGALVASVTKGGPAESAGVEQGDVILEFDGREVTEMRKLPRMVAETPIGSEVEVVVWRKGERKTVRVMLGELREEELAAATEGTVQELPSGTVADLGLTLDTITAELRSQFGLPDKTEGVVITEVDPTGSAAEKQLRPGDVIVEVDQEKVSTPAEVAELVNKAKDEGYRVVTLLVLRQGDFQWVAVRIDQS
ncbi:MAG TPA: DegQ family serine endoprotease [Kiloniellales bacterium]|nr:DegQ family serine endoprotease [Kiloniellales bacterium]